MKELYNNLGIQKNLSAVSHPQSNGQTDVVNKIIKHMLKAKLEDKKGCYRRSYLTSFGPITSLQDLPWEKCLSCLLTDTKQWYH